jgi:hypothetical protein
MNEADDKLSLALKRLIGAIKPFADGEADMIDIQETCIALEDVTAAAGVPSLTVRELRRELQKRGLNRPLRGGGASNEE